MRQISRLLPIAAVALLLAGCADIKSSTATQPGAIGRVLHTSVTFCSMGPVGGSPFPTCAAGTDQTGQLLLVYSVPAFASLPDTLTAKGSADGTDTTFSRVRSLPAQFGLSSSRGRNLVGYISDVITESPAEERDWTIDADLTLPARVHADTAEPGPVPVQLYGGWRVVDDTHPADRPVDCNEAPLTPGSPPFPSTDPATSCDGNAQGPGSLGINDLVIGSPDAASVESGHDVTFKFPLSFGSTAATPATFAISAQSTAPGATFTIPHPTYEPGTLDPATHLAAPTSRGVRVHVPERTKPGSYTVTLTAETPDHGTVAATAPLTVTAPPAPVVTPVPTPAATPAPVTTMPLHGLGTPSHIGWKSVSRKGLLARVTVPVAGSKVDVALLGPKVHGQRRVLVSRSRTVAAPGVARFRLKLSRHRAQALANRGLLERVQATITAPGGTPSTLTRDFPIL